MELLAYLYTKIFENGGEDEETLPKYNSANVNFGGFL